MHRVCYDYLPTKYNLLILKLDSIIIILIISINLNSFNTSCFILQLSALSNLEKNTFFS